MPIALQLGLSGNVVSSGDAWPVLEGSLSRADEAPITLVGTVDDTALASYNARVTWHYFRVKLGGEWIPESDLAGNLDITGGIDSAMRTFSFGLLGERWSILLTEQTWTRTPVEVWTYRGATPSAMIGQLEIDGYVVTCDQDDDHGPVLQVRCADRAALYDRHQLCHEVEPFAGKTRGELVRDLLAGAGITDAEIPAGARYDKPVQVANRRLWDYLREFAEPEGWILRWQGDRLTFRRVEITEDPQPPADVWTPDDWEQLRLQPPATNTASRWILRGTAPVVYVDEAGFETELNETAVVAPYRPIQAVEQQLTTGEIVDLPGGVLGGQQRDRVISRIVDERVTKGGRVIRHDVKEWGWYNPRRAKLVSTTSGFYAFEQALIDETGNFVLWRSERFVLRNASTTVPTYDAEGNLTTSTETRRTYRLRTQGVGPHGSATPNVQGAYIHQDDQSYLERWEIFDTEEELQTRYEYDPTTGAQFRETLDRYTHYSPRCRVTGPPVGGWYNLYNGEAQTDLVANWRKIETVTTTKRLSSDAAVLGEAVLKFGYGQPSPVWGGQYDWGGVQSNQEEQRFGFLSQESRRFDVLSEDQYEITTRDAGGNQNVETVAGKLPLPRFLLSAWTSYAQNPIEVVIDDATIAAWFGFQRSAFENEFVQSIEEAQQLLARRIRRSLARKIEVVRPRTLATEGDTIHLIDPRHGLDHRGLIVAESPSYDLRTGAALATYQLEVYL